MKSQGENGECILYLLGWLCDSTCMCVALGGGIKLGFLHSPFASGNLTIHKPLKI